MRQLFVIAVIALFGAGSESAFAVKGARWSPEQAHEWYRAQGWLVGANYVPSNAINQIEMWQAATFDPKRIDQELGWAKGFGMNTMRVFLHDALWEQDREGFKQRIDAFLAIAARHGIKPMLVLFDSCWDPAPKLGPQHPPTPGVHNSGWVQGPGAAILDDPSRYPMLQAYVNDIVGHFRNDDRILAWDVWNEPDNPGGGDYKNNSPKKMDRVAHLLPKVFAWARDAGPSQPLTSGVWRGHEWSNKKTLNEIQKVQLSESDIITFHDYGWPESFEKRVNELKTYGRPILCTEYVARGAGSTFDTILPLGKKHDVGMINWGLVNGRTQTDLPWDSWERPYTLKKPAVWFHDILREDGTPYRERELELFRTLTGISKPQ